ncbi:dNTP triphosphohydrolase [Cohnella sp. LGH]|uniref:deoxyguanosinetriphosphate triphosphohydrolase family protein n=1 Tax=Cohnella sp. LGH TaxID=1619153 RepID=UPI001ADB8113|nr:dNTP triphosphohydrolase [Cohnella sp. LGH]QTH42634.1 dNTP triphosphohydrolase [Cohnella sp. LGH]
MAHHYDPITLEYVRDQAELVRDLDFRLHPGESAERGRDEYSRDYARILYSASFRRLQGKMQLLGVDQHHFIRNRLTHSMEVAQIARGIALDMDIENTFVAEACALAHDLGNPPIGHHGETVLNELVGKIGGFEGNAQTLRILRKLEKKHHAYRGLNLTFRTQLGVIKYFRRHDGGQNKKFIYDEDYDGILRVLGERGIRMERVRTIDMQIMDLAEEIAYAAHDLEDCLSQNLFTIDDLLYEFHIDDKYKTAYGELDRIVKDCREFAYKGRHLGSSEEYSFLFRKELTSVIVNRLIRDIHYNEAKKRLDYKEYGELARGLKKLVFLLIMRRPSVQLYEKRGEKVLRGLFQVFADERTNADLKLLPPEYRMFADEAERLRNVADFISGMMDQFAMHEYEKYYGAGELNRLV